MMPQKSNAAGFMRVLACRLLLPCAETACARWDLRAVQGPPRRNQPRNL